MIINSQKTYEGCKIYLTCGVYGEEYTKLQEDIVLTPKPATKKFKINSNNGEFILQKKKKEKKTEEKLLLSIQKERETNGDDGGYRER